MIDWNAFMGLYPEKSFWLTRWLEMPELPEVETVVRDLRPLLADRLLANISKSGSKLRRPWKKEWGNQLEGKKILGLRRRGKWILMDISGDFCLIIHLGMTGQLCVFPRQEPLEDHTHLVFELGNGAYQLRFRDVRRFGSAELIPSAKVTDFFEKKHIGPEPFDVDPDYWHKAIKASKRNMKAILLDQQVVCGVGNIYADESLYAAGIHPARKGASLSHEESQKLIKCVEKVLKNAIEKRGSTIRDYIGGSRLKGGFQDEFMVYGRDEESCMKCNSKIHRQVLAGRSSHFCPKCQPAKPSKR